MKKSDRTGMTLYLDIRRIHFNRYNVEKIKWQPRKGGHMPMPVFPVLQSFPWFESGYGIALPGVEMYKSSQFLTRDGDEG